MYRNYFLVERKNLNEYLPDKNISRLFKDVGHIKELFRHPDYKSLFEGLGIMNIMCLEDEEFKDIIGKEVILDSNYNYHQLFDDNIYTILMETFIIQELCILNNLIGQEIRVLYAIKKSTLRDIKLEKILNNNENL